MQEKAWAAFLVKLKPVLIEHWKSCMEGGLPHTLESGEQVVKLISDYASTLRALPEPAPEADIMSAMRHLFAELDELNSAVDDGLLETDERELLVPIIIEAATLAGLDVSRFSDDDPTGEFRNF